MNTFTWTELDAKAVDTARVLAADAVEKVGNGHPGAAISLAPVAHVLFQKVMRFDPADDAWLGRDRFVLSAGHSSMTQYAQLFLAGYGLELSDLQALRTWGALTPGHPEAGRTPGVECTTGPLGAGIATAVGFAMASRRAQELYDPDARPGESVFDHAVYCIVGDGCIQEGVTYEACSLAAAQGLGNLIVLYDDNRISIEGDTAIAFCEDVDARFAAQGWHTQHVDFTEGGSGYIEKPAELFEAIAAAQAVTDRPSLIRVTTVIGWPLPTKAGTADIHGAKLGAAEIAGLKERLGFELEPFAIDPEVVAATRAQAAARAAEARAAWTPRYQAWRSAHPDRAALLDRVRRREVPADLDGALPVFGPGSMATRAASGKVLAAVADVLPELWGGSADLGGSNNTTIAGASSFLPAERGTAGLPGGAGGRRVHFGIREHAMGNILNGIALDGLSRAYGGTFLVFSDYMRTPPRLAALSHAPSIFVWTHDSIGVGEDGPTHQPIEHLMSLRLMPGLDVIRPGDANETAQVWGRILRTSDHPSALVLSRQNTTTFDRSPGSGFAPATGAVRGGYVLVEASAEPQVVLVGTGTELALAVEARELLEAEGIPARVVSLPCVEWFRAQDASYRARVLPAGTPRVVVEAGVTVGWQDLLGAGTEAVGIDHFGASAAAGVLYAEFGITADAVAARARALVAADRSPVPSGVL